MDVRVSFWGRLVAASFSLLHSEGVAGDGLLQQLIGVIPRFVLERIILAGLLLAL